MKWLLRTLWKVAWFIDSLVIDWVFQPITNMLAPILSCYEIAAFLLTGSIPAQILVLVYYQFWLGLLISVFWMPMVLIRAYQLQKTPFNVMPTERIIGMPMRLIFLFMVSMNLDSDLMLLESNHVLFFIVEVGWWVLVVALYFMACRRVPPRPKRSMVFKPS